MKLFMMVFSGMCKKMFSWVYYNILNLFFGLGLDMINKSCSIPCGHTTALSHWLLWFVWAWSFCNISIRYISFQGQWLWLWMTHNKRLFIVPRVGTKKNCIEPWKQKTDWFWFSISIVSQLWVSIYKAEVELTFGISWEHLWWLNIRIL